MRLDELHVGRIGGPRTVEHREHGNQTIARALAGAPHFRQKQVARQDVEGVVVCRRPWIAASVFAPLAVLQCFLVEAHVERDATCRCDG